jgi:hypothetical protein
MFNLNQTGNGGCVKRSNKKSAKLVLVLSALWLVAGCTQDKKPAPYRGTWLRNISINSKLAQKFGEKHFDVANSCVQMITRDKTEDGIRKPQRLVLFSPDACPTDNKVADRESFVIPFIENPSFSDKVIPAAAFYLSQENRVMVGKINLVTKGENNQEGKYELVDLCYSKKYARNCSVDFTVEGKFSQVVTTFAPFGDEENLEEKLFTLEHSLSNHHNANEEQTRDEIRAEIEETRVKIALAQREIITKIEGEVGALNRNLSQKLVTMEGNLTLKLDRVQSEILSDVKRQLKNLEDELKNSQLQALKSTVAQLNRSLFWMSYFLHGHINVATQQTINELTKAIERNKREIVAELTAEINHRAQELADTLTTIANSVDAVEAHLGRQDSEAAKLKDLVVEAKADLEIIKLEHRIARSSMGRLFSTLTEIEGRINFQMSDSDRKVMAHFDEMLRLHHLLEQGQHQKDIANATSTITDLVDAMKKQLGSHDEKTIKQLDSLAAQIGGMNYSLASGQAFWSLLIMTKVDVMFDAVIPAVAAKVNDGFVKQLVDMQTPIQRLLADSRNEFLNAVQEQVNAAMMTLATYKADLPAEVAGAMAQNLTDLGKDIKSNELTKVDTTLKKFTDFINSVDNKSNGEVVTKLNTTANEIRDLLESHRRIIRRQYAVDIRDSILELKNTEFEPIRKSITSLVESDKITAPQIQQAVDNLKLIVGRVPEDTKDQVTVAIGILKRLAYALPPPAELPTDVFAPN